MIKTLEAIIDHKGNIRLLEPVYPVAPRRALVVILDEPVSPSEEFAMMSEAALDDWNRPEEDEAWLYLQSPS